MFGSVQLICCSITWKSRICWRPLQAASPAGLAAMGAAAPTTLTASHAAPSKAAVEHAMSGEAQQAGALSSSAAASPAPSPALSLEQDVAQGAAYTAAPISSAAPGAGGAAGPCQRPAGPPAVSEAERVPVTGPSAASPACPPLRGKFQGTESSGGHRCEAHDVAAEAGRPQGPSAAPCSGPRPASPGGQRRGAALARAGSAEAAPAAQSPERDCEWRRRAKQRACGEEARALRAEGGVPTWLQVACGRVSSPHSCTCKYCVILYLVKHVCSCVTYKPQ